MAGQRYHRRSQEDHVMDLVLGHIDRAVDLASGENPMPIGETRIDPRTARKRLAMVPHDQIFDHLGAHG